MIVKYRLAISLLAANLLLISTQVVASVVHYTPEEYAKMCPIIVAGVITKTGEAGAHIKVNAVFKNVLKDVEVKIGDALPVTMSPRSLFHGTSVDIRYDKGTEGIWLIYLHNKSSGLTIAANPVQLQPLANEETLRSKGVFSTEKEELPDGKPADKLYSTDEWLMKMKQEQPLIWNAMKERKARERKLYAAPVAAGTRVAQNPYDTGHDLYLWSKEYKKPDGQNDKNRFEAGMFIGYVSGVNAARRGHRSSLPSLDFCTPLTVTKSQLCDIVAKYLEGHPQKRDARGGSSADDLVIYALAEAFPCK